MDWNDKDHKKDIKKVINSLFENILKRSSKKVYRILDKGFKKNVSLNKFEILPKYNISLGKLKKINIVNINKKTRRSMVRASYLRKGEFCTQNIYLVYQDGDWKVDAEMLYRN